ncbi:MAG TPA: DegV family protein [Solirubrobacteraceae bacterium]|jgi:DegV family protein with EDD domain|nr:DegV family protein [Solirubrobacteraceae bacterium]
MPVAIVSDTCHYLPAALAERNHIHQVSLYVHRSGRDERESELTDYNAYYGELGSAADLPTTSQPSIGDFLAVYEPLLQAGREIVSIHLAGGMSGTVRAAEQARDQLGDLAERVRVVDSATACGGEALILLAAAAAARAGGRGADVEARAREARRQLKLWFAIDTLEYLRRGGRIAGAQAWLGTALKIKPILSVESEITPVERVRTSRRAFEKLVGLLETCRRDGADGWVVQHIQAPEQAAELEARGRAIFGTDPVMVSEVGPVIGTHVGPGLLGAGGIPRALMS